MKVWKLNRTFTSKELHWLDENEVWKEDEIVYEYTGFTYGCVTSNGEAIRKDPTKDTFCEIPKYGLNLIGEFKFK